MERKEAAEGQNIRLEPPTRTARRTRDPRSISQDAEGGCWVRWLRATLGTRSGGVAPGGRAEGGGKIDAGGAEKSCAPPERLSGARRGAEGLFEAGGDGGRDDGGK